MRRPHLKCSTVFGILLLIFRIACSEMLLEAMVDGSVKMPCDVVHKEGDSVEFIFWYKTDGVTAIYTLDARRRGLRDAVHIRNETYSDRVHFHVAADMPYLQMDFLRGEDSGSYYCRVDYQWSATEMTRVELIVVVPPKVLLIRDDAGQEIFDIAGPYKEKSDISLTCEAQQGFPTPNLTWWRDDKLYDNTFQKYSNGVVNDMKLSNLSRSDLFATFHCKAQNTNLVPPVIRTIVLDIYLYPLMVRITTGAGLLSAGKGTEVVCETEGSRPSATITWRLNGTLLTDHTETVHRNTTVSVLRLRPEPRHHGVSLSCKSENPKIYGSILEDTRILNVRYIPQVLLRIIKEDADRTPKEDDYVRMVCDVNANPTASRIGWLFDDLPINLNDSGADVVTNNVLVFKRLMRINKGRYRCFATNDEGTGFSQELTLNVSHAPVCKANQQVTYAVALNESVTVRCEVEADPTDVTFKWEFSNTVRKHYDLRHNSNGVVSTALYRPTTPADYGTLFCWANNSVGHQLSSCFFTVIAPACKAEKGKVNASSLSRDDSDGPWNYTLIITGAVAVVSFMLIVTVSVFLFRRRCVEKKKKRRPSQQAFQEEVDTFNRLQYQNNTQQLHIIITK